MAYRLHTPIILGYTPTDLQPVMQTVALDTAAKWLEFGFMPHKDLTLSEVAIESVGFVGTPGTDIECELCDASDTVIATAPSSSSWNSTGWGDFTAIATAVLQGEQYWIRIRNGHATPASNYITVQVGPAGSGGYSVMTSQDLIGWNARQSTDSGATYPTYRRGAAGYQLKFSDASYQGLALSSVRFAAAPDAIYQTRRFGARLTTPFNADLNLQAVAVSLGAQLGTPAAGLVAEVYSPTSLVATSLVCPATRLAVGAQRAFFPFATPFPLTSNSDYRIVIGMPTSSGDAANCYQPYSVLLRASTGSRSVVPFKGTMKQTYYDGAVWTDDQDRLPILQLFLDNDGDFAVLAAGGGGAGGLVGGGMVR